MTIVPADAAAMAAQLGRPVRDARSVAHRCPCGAPDVVETAPRLEDGSPFPTLYYLTCPRATGAVSTLESQGLMRAMADRLGADPALAAAYARAHEDYLRRREQVAHVEEIAGTSAGGMPDRVKCLHVLVAHSLAAGPGSNPLGDEALALLPQWWRSGSCVSAVVGTSAGGSAAGVPAAYGRGHRRTDGRRSAVTRVAAIDCGTNSVRLLVADVDTAAGTLVDVDRRMEIVRLGEGVDRTGRLSAAALARTFAACRTYATVVADLGAERTRFVATSASRDAENRDEFVAGVRELLGVEPEVVSGDEEAALSFRGATGELLSREVPTPYLVVDIGGGSTEFVLGGTSVEAARSVDVGCVRLTERHLHADPPTSAQVAAARRDIEAALAHAAETVPLSRARTLVGLAGSVTTVAAMAMDLPAYDAARIHLSRIAADDVRRVAERLLAMTHAERAALPFMHPGRVDVIGAGALVLAEVVARLGLPEVVVSEHDILDGIALSLG